MAHFAEVVNNIVVRVIVAEQDFIDTMPGEWVKTSYNTLDGVHYGPDGKPDGGEPLRRNFAGCGSYYDKVNDEFNTPPEKMEEYTYDTDKRVWLLTSPAPILNLDGLI